MLELLSPAGSPEAVIAAVQNGADAVYMGLDGFNARRGAKNFSVQEFVKAARYCHIRGCKVYVTLNTLVSDKEMKEAVELAKVASDAGADAILVQDLGLASVLRQALPDIPLHASTQMSVHNLAGVLAAQQMGITRVVLAREMSLEQIRWICQNTSVEIEVFVHGALCFCHSGQCYMSSMIGRRSGNRGMCAQPCRMQYSLGGRMDNYPMSLKDNCLVNYLHDLEEAGVKCVKIEGRMKRPEYSAIVTGIYSKVIKNNHVPTQEEMELLENAFSRQGFTDGYLTGKKNDMFGVREEPGREVEKIYDEARQQYANQEAKRVSLKMYTRIVPGRHMQTVCVDEDGNQFAVAGPVPEQALKQQLNESLIRQQLTKTGGTPYIVSDVQIQVSDGLHLPTSVLNETRRKLISGITEERARPPQRTSRDLPAIPMERSICREPKMIFQFHSVEQMTATMADMKPDYIYVPMDLMVTNFDAMLPFIENGAIPVVVLPRIIYDRDSEDIRAKLEGLFRRGINECLCGNLGHVFLAREAKMNVRGDFGLNILNSWSLDMARRADFLSATASFEMRMAQVRDLSKSLDTELIAYGRMPLMVSDQCIISRSAGKCNCDNPASMSDRTGSVFPVVREYGCRNVVYNAHKLFLADKMEDLLSCGLWGIRLMFTTENPRECEEIARCYKGESQYQPNVKTRGLYYRGVE